MKKSLKTGVTLGITGLVVSAGLYGGFSNLLPATYLGSHGVVHASDSDKENSGNKDKKHKDDKGKKDKDKGKPVKKDDKNKKRKLVTSSTRTVDGVKVTLKTELAEKTPYFTAGIENTTATKKTASFTSSELYSYTIKDEKKRVVFDSKKSFFYLSVMFSKEIPANKQYFHSIELGKAVLKDLKEGVYSISITPEATEYTGKPLTVDFKVDKGYKKK